MFSAVCTTAAALYEVNPSNELSEGPICLSFSLFYFGLIPPNTKKNDLQLVYLKTIPLQQTKKKEKLNNLLTVDQTDLLQVRRFAEESIVVLVSDEIRVPQQMLHECIFSMTSRRSSSEDLCYFLLASPISMRTHYVSIPLIHFMAILILSRR